MFTTASDALAFLLAGNARITLVSKKTQARFTYRIRRPAEDKPWFVQLLTGPDNENSYTFMATIFAGRGGCQHSLMHGRRSPIGQDAPSAVAFAWTFRHLLAGNLPTGIEIHHEGRCGRCGRALTVPESIESGFGPECIGKLAA
jgi:hypothetical protein